MPYQAFLRADWHQSGYLSCMQPSSHWNCQ